MAGYATGLLEYSDDTLAVTSRITNPTFDTDLTGWTENDAGVASLTPTHETAITHSGAGSMKLVDTVPFTEDHMRTTFTGTAGVAYQIRAWVNVTSFTNGFNGLFAFDATAAVIENDTIIAATDGWEMKEITITPATTGNVTIRLYSVEGTLYWDDVSIVAWNDRSSYVLGDVTWSDGKARDLDEPQAGSLMFRLSNRDGEWIPNSPDSLYPDSPFLLRRFRWSVDDTPEGVWYVVKWDVTYPAGTEYSEVVVTCVDGFELLALDALDLLSPATATSYEEVVMQDAPFAFYRLGEPGGTAMVAAAGVEGVYKNTPTFQQAAQIAGDSGTSVEFGRGEYGQAGVEDNQFVDVNALTLECWAQVTDTTNPGPLMQGPFDTGVGDYLFVLHYGATTFSCNVVTTGGNYQVDVTATVTNLHHVAGTWDGSTLRLYLDGELVDTEGTAGAWPTPDANPKIYVGDQINIGPHDVLISNAAFYERCLSAERVLAHYNAGASGFAEQPAGERVAAVAESTLWEESGIQAGSHTVKAVMETGQSKLDEIRAAVKAEMPDTHFYFGGDGDPVYLGWDYKGASPYNEAQGTFGPSDIPYQDVEIVYDDEMFNEVTVGHEAAAGEETQHTETDSDSVDEFYRRAHSETGLILTEHTDAEAVAAAILEAFHEPKTRVASLTVNGAHTPARTQILERQIGDLIRVKGVTGTPDVLTTILGRSKTLTAAGHLTCTWSLARGIDATADVWYLGMDSYSELGETTTLG